MSCSKPLTLDSIGNLKISPLITDIKICTQNNILLQMCTFERPRQKTPRTSKSQSREPRTDGKADLCHQQKIKLWVFFFFLKRSGLGWNPVRVEWEESTSEGVSSFLYIICQDSEERKSPGNSAKGRLGEGCCLKI